MTKLDEVVQYLQQRKMQETIKEIDAEIAEEFKDGVPDVWLNKAQAFLDKMQKQNSVTESNVVTAPFGQKKTPKAPVEFLESFELLAAAADDQSPWFAQRISANGDYIIEISPFDDNPDEAGIVITAAPGKEEKLQAWLNAYKGQTISVSLSWDKVTIFEADLYVDLNNARAEGEGKIVRADRQASGGRLSFKIDKTEE
ncbi:hypothetical protein ACVUMT_003471 [Vibrio cholerae]|nr:hypothetical protein [Vibrio vulnificus]HDY7578934.1 hypothetical protein [Vibrio vulnificus]